MTTITGRYPAGHLPIHIMRVKIYLDENPVFKDETGSKLRYLFDAINTYKQEIREKSVKIDIKQLF